jgi:hypothetical protein
MSQESYDAVAKAANALREAMDAYAEARYQNYRNRLVSPSGAYSHAIDDLSEIVEHRLNDARSQLAYMHAKEINS